MGHAVIGKWGKNLAVRFPSEIASEIGLREGERVEIEAGSEQIIIWRSKPHYTLDQLFAGKSPAEWRAAYARAYDWGPDVGHEIIEE